MIGRVVTTGLAPAVLAGGILLALIGLWWLWSGLDIVQVERGWSAVIAGATVMSAGMVIVALAGVIAMLRRIADGLQAPSEAHSATGDPTVASRAPDPLESQNAEPDHPRMSYQAPDGREQHRPEANAGDRQIVGRHVSGEATYVMFSDGSVEAQTPGGVMTFPSLEALRAYADEREANADR